MNPLACFFLKKKTAWSGFLKTINLLSNSQMKNRLSRDQGWLFIEETSFVFFSDCAPCSETTPETVFLSIGVSKNWGYPKWMVYNGKPYFLMDDLGGKPPIFGNTHIERIAVSHSKVPSMTNFACEILLLLQQRCMKDQLKMGSLRWWEGGKRGAVFCCHEIFKRGF